MQRLFDRIKSQLQGAKDRGNHDAQRLFHGRGQTYEGLGFINVDYFHPVLWVTLYEEQGDEWFQQLSAGLIELAQQFEITAIGVQFRYIQEAPSEMILGELPAGHCAEEDGLRYTLRLGEKQNIGFFLDMVEGRQWIKQHSNKKRVLNLFSYTCAFSVVAMAGGADYVMNVDMAKPALAIGRENHKQNRLDVRSVDFLGYNIFKSWNKIKQKGPYDVVVLDPPYFQKGRFETKKDYERLIKNIPNLMPNGGEVLASLNAPNLPSEFLLELFEEFCPKCELVERLKNTETFADKYPERALKVFHYHYKGG